MFVFNGFFARADGSVLEVVLRKWPECKGRIVDDPFIGIGIICPNPQVAEQLPDWTQQFPTITFVFITAECFGGACDYFGYACRDGQIITRIEEVDSDLQVNHNEFLRLLTYLGVEQKTDFFAPFQRGYFD